MLYLIVRGDMMKARVEKDSQRLVILSTLIGELSANAKLENGEKTVSDADVISLVKKFVKNIDELLTSDPKNEKALFERRVLEKYMPKHFTKEQLIEKIQWEIENGADNMGAVMKALKGKFDGNYDGKMASQLANELLKK